MDTSERDRPRGGFRPIVQDPPSVSGSFNSPYCQVALAKFVIVLDYGHFVREHRENRTPCTKLCSMYVQ